MFAVNAQAVGAVYVLFLAMLAFVAVAYVTFIAWLVWSVWASRPEKLPAPLTLCPTRSLRTPPGPNS